MFYVSLYQWKDKLLIKGINEILRVLLYKFDKDIISRYLTLRWLKSKLN